VQLLILEAQLIVYKGEKTDHLDIVKFELPEQFRPEPMTYFKGRVIDQDSNLPLKAEVSIESIDGVSKTYQTNYNGQFLIAIPVGTPTQIHITSEGYVFYSDYITYNEIRHGVNPHESEIALEIPELALEEDATEPIVLKNIFFETGSAQLLPASDSEIDYLFDLLNKYPVIRIRIVGHTDNVGDEEANLRLSQERAESVKSALVLKGIDATRIDAIGMGETQPIDTNDTPQGRSGNRRTEFLIVK